MNTTRYEIEWPIDEPKAPDGSTDFDAMTWEFEHRSTLKEARSFARKALRNSPMKVAYVTRETYYGHGDPLTDELNWERDANTREEFSA